MCLLLISSLAIVKQGEWMGHELKQKTKTANVKALDLHTLYTEHSTPYFEEAMRKKDEHTCVFLSFEKALKFCYSLFDVLMKKRMVAKEIFATIRKHYKELRIHVLHILRYGILYVIFLPLHGGMGIDALFLVKEGIGSLYGTAWNHWS